MNLGYFVDTRIEKNVIGCFSNILPLTVNITKTDSVRTIYGRISEQRMAVKPHQRIPLYSLLKGKQVKEAIRRPFNVLINESAALMRECILKLNKIKITSIRPSKLFAQYDLALIFILNENKDLKINFEYNKDNFSQKLMVGFRDTFYDLFSYCVDYPDLKIGNFRPKTDQKSQIDIFLTA